MKILREDGITGEVAYALLTRPDPAMRGALRQYTSARSPVKENLLALAMLQRLGDPTGSELEEIASRKDLTPAMRHSIVTLLNRNRSRTMPQWNDVADVASE
jgi:hypothetical protein